MPTIAYVGLKERKEDNVAGTGLVWSGHGDTHTVSKRDAALLLKHPDVWAEVGEEGAQDNGAAGLSGAKTSQAAEDQGSKVVDDGLEAMDIDALKDLAKSRGIATGNSGKARIVALLREAAAPKSE